MMNEQEIIALDVMERAAHSGITLTEPQVVGWVLLGRLAPAPIPIATTLKVNDEETMPANDFEAALKAEVIDAGECFLEDLRTHDRRADGEHHAAVEIGERAAEQFEVDLAGPA